MNDCRYEKKETVERFVAGLYEDHPGMCSVKWCTACGFTMDDEEMDRGSGFATVRHKGAVVRVSLFAEARFCPICGSRFSRDEDYGWGRCEPEQEKKLSDEDYKELIGEELFARLAEQSGEKKD